jgi:glutamate dehydrogenase (NAD(P)+)
MSAAYRELNEALRQRPELGDRRTAAFFVAIEKIARAYLELGIFP